MRRARTEEEQGVGFSAKFSEYPGGASVQPAPPELNPLNSPRSSAMKKLFRTGILLFAALATACTSPYQAQMGALNQAYAAGMVAPSEYNRQMSSLAMADAGWQQANANAATTAAVVGIAALGTAAIISAADDDCRPRRHYSSSSCYTPRYYSSRSSCYTPRHYSSRSCYTPRYSYGYDRCYTPAPRCGW